MPRPARERVPSAISTRPRLGAMGAMEHIRRPGIPRHARQPIRVISRRA
ncbi:hypothetical protein [Thiocystis violacea]|nr:hypothetical protein [Thiocystis violacea]